METTRDKKVTRSFPAFFRFLTIFCLFKKLFLFYNIKRRKKGTCIFPDVVEGAEESLLRLLKSWGKRWLRQCRRCHIRTAC
jgi:hypothetical protein